jgi:thioesterase domain-containing protein/aryl carrier-like protein
MNKPFEASKTTARDQPALPPNASPTDLEKLETSILSICRQLLRTFDFGVTDNFFDAGGDSLLAMTLALDIERQTGVKVDLQTIFATPTVRDICAASLRELTERKPVAIVPIRSGSPQKFLYYIHGAFEFSALSDALPDDISIAFTTINDPQWFHQRASDKDTLAAIDQLCDAYAETIMRRERPGFCCLAGSSAGGILAIETARKLEQRGFPPDLVFLFDTYLHGSARRILHNILYNGWLHQKIQQALRLDRQLLARTRLLFREALSRMNRSDALKASLTDPEADLGLIFHDIREKISRAYRGPQCALKAHTVLFRATETRDGRPMRADPNLGWARQLERKLTVIPVPGDHFSLLTGDHARYLAKEMERQIRLLTGPM